MKKLLIFLFVLISAKSNAIGWETITGNGNLKTETRQASGYNAISSAGSMNVQIAYGNTSNITVEADENLLPYIETTVENGKLIIKTKKGYNLKTKHKMVVNVSLTKLTSLSLSGSGNVSGDGAFSNPGKTDISISGSGNIKLGFDNFSELNTSISGSGNIDLRGKNCNNITATISGSGNIDCSNVQVNDVFAKVSGSGNIKVNTTKSIDAKVSGSGNVFYKGNPTSIVSKASGSGKIIKI
jgi:hypothetical protein